MLIADATQNAPRWRAGERLETVFERRCDELGELVAVELEDARLTYRELDARANQLARHLRERHGVRPGDRVALLLDRALDGYLAMLAVLKLHAAYVPLDPSFPEERRAFIVQDAGAGLLLTSAALAQAQRAIAAQPSGPLAHEETGDPVGELAYVIYTSGTTGRPKGVAVNHSSIVNFIRVAAELYGYRTRRPCLPGSDDRV